MPGDARGVVFAGHSDPVGPAPLLSSGKFIVRLASEPQDMARVHALRSTCFRTAPHSDQDGFDKGRTHVLVEARDSGSLVCCFRLLVLEGHELAHSYAAQFYGLERLAAYPGLMMELGRFCVHPDWPDPDIVRLAWAALTDQVDRHGIEMLFGCSSFEGVEVTRYRDAFALLKARHQAPARWRPGVKAPHIRTHEGTPDAALDTGAAMRQMPPLLRTYLMMGGWVSDHAVVDHQLQTLHVFTGLEICAIPPVRKRLLRALV